MAVVAMIPRASDSTLGTDGKGRIRSQIASSKNDVLLYLLGPVQRLHCVSGQDQAPRRSQFSAKAGSRAKTRADLSARRPRLEPEAPTWPGPPSSRTYGSGHR